MTDETIFTNAVLVLPDATLHGTLVMQGATTRHVNPAILSGTPAGIPGTGKSGRQRVSPPIHPPRGARERDDHADPR